MASNHDHNEPHIHITPMSTYLKVAGALFALTFLTVIAHYFHTALGPLAGPIAFLIAAVKAVLVILWFMHLKDDSAINRMIFGSGFFFLLLLFVICQVDIWTRIRELSPL
jgi:cytochrome c oxidase subunit 4